MMFILIYWGFNSKNCTIAWLFNHITICPNRFVLISIKISIFITNESSDARINMAEEHLDLDLYVFLGICLLTYFQILFDHTKLPVKDSSIFGCTFLKVYISIYKCKYLK